MPSHKYSRTALNLFLLPALAVFAITTATPGFAQIPTQTSGRQQVSMSVMSPPTPTNLPTLSSTLLCGIVDCGPTKVISQPPPIIAEVSPASVIEPGGNVLVHGTDFNGRNGSYGMVVLIVGDPRALSHREFVLQNTQWSNKAAFGQIPSDISGLIDQAAWLQVRRTDGVNSDPVKVQFTARRTTGALSRSDFQVEQCSQAADQNQCNTWADYSPPWPLYNWNFVGVHRVFLGKDTGTDTFHITLKNGWALTWGGQFGHWINFGGCDSPGGASAPQSQVSGSDVTLTITWVSTCEIYYAGTMLIVGPQGVPWK
jgi:hypothetical protein